MDDVTIRYSTINTDLLDSIKSCLGWNITQETLL